MKIIRALVQFFRLSENGVQEEESFEDHQYFYAEQVYYQYMVQDICE